MKRSILQFICVLGLLFAQQGAFTHAIWHVHGTAARQHHGDQKSSAQGDLCKLHGLFTQVAGGAPASVFHFAMDDALNEHSVQFSEPRHSVRPLAARSRGPPRLA
jgi:hypothetical protein